MDSENLLTAADSLFVHQDYEAALLKYDELASQEEVPKLGLYLLRRGITKLKLGKYTSAISDFNDARMEDAELTATSLEFEARALFHSEDFKMADRKFRAALKTNPELSDRLDAWILKCKREIEGKEIKAEISDFKKPEPQPTKQTSPPQITKVDYYQNQEDVNVTLIFKPKLTEAQKKCIKIILGQEEVQIESAELKINKKLRLYSSIQPDKSTYRFGVHLELKLKKHMAGMQWMKLEQQDMGDGVVMRDNIVAASQPPSYPSSSKKHLNWNEVDRDIEKELKKDKPEGEAAMMGMFRDIFAQGDEDTQRAMMKSYQTSGGTVLSTNWKEVQEKDYEGKDRPSAPDGQQWADDKDKYK